MTKKELKLLGLDSTILNIDATRPMVDPVVNPYETDKCYIRIGKCTYYDFAEAQAIINNLEKHYDYDY